MLLHPDIVLRHVTQGHRAPVDFGPWCVSCSEPCSLLLSAAEQWLPDTDADGVPVRPKTQHSNTGDFVLVRSRLVLVSTRFLVTSLTRNYWSVESLNQHDNDTVTGNNPAAAALFWEPEWHPALLVLLFLKRVQDHWQSSKMFQKKISKDILAEKRCCCSI